MSTLTVDVSKNGNITQNGSVRGSDDSCMSAEIEECDFSKLSDRPKPLNQERRSSFEDKSFSDLSFGMSPRHALRNVDNSSRINNHFDHLCSPVISSLATPRAEQGGEPHPSISEAWDALRRSLVYFRGKPVGTIAARDNSLEKLNYDQIRLPTRAGLTCRSMFQSFIICNTIATYSSILVVVILLVYISSDDDPKVNWTSYASSVPLIRVAVLAMSGAFATGIYPVLGKLHWLQIVVLIIGRHRNLQLFHRYGLHTLRIQTAVHPVVHIHTHIPRQHFSGISSPSPFLEKEEEEDPKGRDDNSEEEKNKRERRDVN